LETHAVTVAARASVPVDASRARAMGHKVDRRSTFTGDLLRDGLNGKLNDKLNDKKSCGASRRDYAAADSPRSRRRRRMRANPRALVATSAMLCGSGVAAICDPLAVKVAVVPTSPLIVRSPRLVASLPPKEVKKLSSKGPESVKEEESV
jgi:hypothetical protein